MIAYPEGIPVEIQVRTKWQHEWADMFEKLADLIGREIRYGEPPAHWWDRLEDLRDDKTPEQVVALRKLYDTSYRLHVLMTRSAIVLGDLIDALEEVEVAEPDDDGEHDEEVRDYWEKVREGLANLREEMGGMTPVSQRGDLGNVGS